MIHRTAHIGENVHIAHDAEIWPHAYLDADGWPIVIGPRCTVGPGARIGQIGFGYAYDEDDGWLPKEHEYGVNIAADVDVGANTCIDRGSWRATSIGRGTKIDNLVHIAHNVVTGEDCMIIAHAEISGSVELADRVYVAPRAAVRERLSVGEGSIVGMGAVVLEDVPAGVVVAGVPARVLKRVSEWPPPPPEGK